MAEKVIVRQNNNFEVEVLFQSRVHPMTKANSLGKDKTGEIYGTIQEVFQTAIDNHANPEQFPDSYLLPHRQEGDHCPRCGSLVKKIKVSSRYGYFCPECQGENP